MNSQKQIFGATNSQMRTVGVSEAVFYPLVLALQQLAERCHDADILRPASSSIHDVLTTRLHHKSTLSRTSDPTQQLKLCMRIELPAAAAAAAAVLTLCWLYSSWQNFHTVLMFHHQQAE